jgi:hypothetical protein
VALVTLWGIVSYLWMAITHNTSNNNINSHQHDTALSNNNIQSSQEQMFNTFASSSRVHSAERSEPTIQVCTPASSTPTYYFKQGRPMPSFENCGILGNYVSAKDYSTGKLTLQNHHQTRNHLDARVAEYSIGLHRPPKHSGTNANANMEVLVALTSKVKGYDLRRYCRKNDVELTYHGEHGEQQRRATTTLPSVLNLFALEHLEESSSSSSPSLEDLHHSTLSYPFDEQELDNLYVVDTRGIYVPSSSSSSSNLHTSTSGSPTHPITTYGNPYLSASTTIPISSPLGFLSSPFTFFHQRDRFMKLTQTQRALPPLWPLLLKHRYRSQKEYISQFTIHNSHFTFHISHFTFYILYFTFHILHVVFYVLHFHIFTCFVFNIDFFFVVTFYISARWSTASGRKRHRP